MTPLEIDIILHYYAIAEDYRGGDHSAPAVGEAIKRFISADMLRPATPNPEDRLLAVRPPAYVVTERGRIYVEALQAVPLPIQKWVMPEAA